MIFSHVTFAVINLTLKVSGCSNRNTNSLLTGSGSRYITVLMAQAKIYWNRENFQMVEKIFRKSVEFCNKDDTWKLNVAHVLFMQNKYKEAIGFYEPIVKKHYDNVSFSEEAMCAERSWEFWT